MAWEFLTFTVSFLWKPWRLTCAAQDEQRCGGNQVLLGAADPGPRAHRKADGAKAGDPVPHERQAVQERRDAAAIYKVVERPNMRLVPLRAKER